MFQQEKVDLQQISYQNALTCSTNDLSVIFEKDSFIHQIPQFNQIDVKRKPLKIIKASQNKTINISIQEEEQQQEEVELQYQWIQSTNKEEFELMKNICYLSQFIDINEGLTEQEYIRLDQQQYYQAMENQDAVSQNSSFDDVEDMENQFEDSLIFQRKDFQQYNRIISNNQFNIFNKSSQYQNFKGVLQKGEQYHINSNLINQGNTRNNIFEYQDIKQQKQILQNFNDKTNNELNHKDKSKKYQMSITKLAQDQFNRISKYGDIALISNIARRNPQTDEYYDQDDSFIDDDQVDKGLKQLAICEADYDDFFVIEGGLNDLVKSNIFKERLDNIQDYRDTKNLESHLVKVQQKNISTSFIFEKQRERSTKQYMLTDQEDDEDQILKEKNNLRQKKRQLQNLIQKQQLISSSDSDNETYQNGRITNQDMKKIDKSFFKDTFKFIQNRENGSQRQQALSRKKSPLVSNKIQEVDKISSISNKNNELLKQGNTNQNYKQHIFTSQKQKIVNNNNNYIIIDEQLATKKNQGNEYFNKQNDYFIKYNEFKMKPKLVKQNSILNIINTEDSQIYDKQYQKPTALNSQYSSDQKYHKDSFKYIKIDSHEELDNKSHSSRYSPSDFLLSIPRSLQNSTKLNHNKGNNLGGNILDVKSKGTEDVNTLYNYNLKRNINNQKVDESIKQIIDNLNRVQQNIQSDKGQYEKDNKQSKQLDIIKRLRKLEINNSKKSFFKDDFLEEVEYQQNTTKLNAKRKIVDPKNTNNQFIEQEMFETAQNSFLSQNQQLIQDTNGDKQNELLIQNNQKSLKRKIIIIKSEKRKRSTDILEETNLHELKLDLKLKEQ